MVRKKIDTSKFIDDKVRKCIVFAKRKRGFLKKAIEVSRLCGWQIYFCMKEQAKDRVIEFRSHRDFDLHSVEAALGRVQPLVHTCKYEQFCNDDYDDLARLDFRDIRLRKRDEHPAWPPPRPLSPSSQRVHSTSEFGGPRPRASSKASAGHESESCPQTSTAGGKSPVAEGGCDASIDRNGKEDTSELSETGGSPLAKPSPSLLGKRQCPDQLSLTDIQPFEAGNTKFREVSNKKPNRPSSSVISITLTDPQEKPENQRAEPFGPLPSKPYLAKDSIQKQSGQGCEGIHENQLLRYKIVPQVMPLRPKPGADQRQPLRKDTLAPRASLTAFQLPLRRVQPAGGSPEDAFIKTPQKTGSDLPASDSNYGKMPCLGGRIFKAPAHFETYRGQPGDQASASQVTMRTGDAASVKIPVSSLGSYLPVYSHPHSTLIQTIAVPIIQQPVLPMTRAGDCLSLLDRGSPWSTPEFTAEAGCAQPKLPVVLELRK